MPDTPLVAHSLAEAYLYLMATPCAACGKGLLKGEDARPIEGDRDPMVVSIAVACGACDAREEYRFELPQGLGTDPNGGPAVVNPTDEPSKAIDVAQWITLFRMIAEAAAKETDKVEARRLGLESAQCLEEALKFYDDADNDLPPSEAFFHATSRERLAKTPEQFSRQRLIELRAKLPTIAVMRSHAATEHKPRKRRWWRRRR